MALGTECNDICEKKLIEPLLKTLGVLEAEMSPFCRRFESLANLKDEYIKYQTKTFVYNDRCGTGTADAEEDTVAGVPDASPEEIVLERVKTFTGAMLKSDEGSDDEDDTSEGETEEVHSDVAPDPAQKDHEELMIKFKDVSSLTSQDLLKNVLSASMCLERADKGCIKGSISDVRKSKSLV